MTGKTWLRPATSLGLLGLIIATMGQPRHTAAQDVLIAGREANVPPPAEILSLLAQDSTAFQFERVWKARALAVRARRAEIASALGDDYTRGQLMAQGASLDGVLYVPVVPALYSDLSAPYSRSQYRRRLFGDGSGAVSASALYSEMSLGVFTVSGSVLPWVDMPHPTSYYELTDEDRFGNVAAFLHDALVLADPLINFGEFDNDGLDGVPNSGDDDGYVDVAAFIYATVAMSCGGTGIWPHRWTYRYAQRAAGGTPAPFETSDQSANGGAILVDDYVIQSGIQCDGTRLMGTGTFSHELGHGIGLPDLYDTDREDGTNSQGIGHWGLMGSGNWNTQMSPAHMSAWSKDQLGWLDVTLVRQQRTRISLGPIHQDGSVARLNAPGSREYFLLANRQRRGSDSELAQPGLLIWHVDPDKVEEGRNRNRVNADANHKGVDLEEADGRDDLDHRNRRNRGDAGDPFPGSTRATEFTVASYPGSHAYSSGSTCTVGVRSISAAGSLISLDLNPSERLEVLGDANGDARVNQSDVAEDYRYAFGWRGGDLQFEVADVDADGDVDIRDGFLIHAYVSGYSVPVNGIGSQQALPCDPHATRISSESTGTDMEEGPRRGGSR